MRSHLAFLAAVIEIGVWALGLIVLTVQDPYSTYHWTLFWPSWIWDIKGPGYNLGHSVSFAMRGHFIESFEAHYLGIPVIIILMCRILSLMRNTLGGGIKTWLTS